MGKNKNKLDFSLSSPSILFAFSSFFLFDGILIDEFDEESD